MKIILKALTVFSGFLTLIACEDNICPDGQTPIRDAQGNLIECFDPVNAEVQNQ